GFSSGIFRRFFPAKIEAAAVFFAFLDAPVDVDVATPGAQNTILHGVGRQFVQGDAEVLDSSGRHGNERAGNGDQVLVGDHVQLRHQELGNARTVPVC